jgi:hypothetical protein
MRRLRYICFVLVLLFVHWWAVGCEAHDTLVRYKPSPEKMLLAPAGASLQCAVDQSWLTAVDPTSDESNDFFQMPGEFEKGSKGLKSPRTAALLSLLLPGAGEVYAGAGTKGRIFLFSEASLWAGFFGFRTYSAWLKDDYKSYAASHAQVNLEDKTDSFFDELAYYDNLDQYNQFGPLYNRGEKLPYPETDLWYWQWDSRESRLHYRDMKNRSKDMSRRALYMVGLSLVNRVVSVVDALKTVNSYNRKRSLQFSQIKFDLKANPLGHDPSVMFYVSRRW